MLEQVEQSQLELEQDMGIIGTVLMNSSVNKTILAAIRPCLISSLD